MMIMQGTTGSPLKEGPKDGVFRGASAVTYVDPALATPHSARFVAPRCIEPHAGTSMTGR